jgi:hypothetical protein
VTRFWVWFTAVGRFWPRCHRNRHLDHKLKFILFHGLVFQRVQYLFNLPNPTLLPTTYSPAFICLGRRRGYWITSNYHPVLKEKNMEMRKCTKCAISWLKCVQHYDKNCTGSKSGRTHVTKPVAEDFRHRIGTGKSYCRTRSDLWSGRFKFIFCNTGHYIGQNVIIIGIFTAFLLLNCITYLFTMNHFQFNEFVWHCSNTLTTVSLFLVDWYIFWCFIQTHFFRNTTMT